MLNDNQVAAFETSGCLMSEHVFDQSVVHSLGNVVLNLVEDGAMVARYSLANAEVGKVRIEKIGVWGATYSWKISNIRLLNKAFMAIAADPFLVQEVSQILNCESVYIWKDQVIYKPPHGVGGATGWHQDSYYWGALADTNQVTAWIAMDEANVRSGCLQMVPGSNRWGPQAELLTQVQLDDRLPAFCLGQPVAARDICMTRGDVHYHHGLTWHAARQNRSERPRRGFAVHYAGGETKVAIAAADESHAPRANRIADDARFTRVWPPP